MEKPTFVYESETYTVNANKRLNIQASKMKFLKTVKICKEHNFTVLNKTGHLNNDSSLFLFIYAIYSTLYGAWHTTTTTTTELPVERNLSKSA